MTALSVIVPAYNEEGNILRLIERVEEVLKGIDHEVVIIDDGSTDKTAEVAKKYAQIYPIRVIKHPKNKGKVEALKTGLKHAQGKYIVFLDADLEYPPDPIPQMLNLATRGHDIVLANRIDPRPPHRKIISTGARILAKLLIPQVRKLKDPTTEMAVISRKLADPDLLKHRYIKPLLPYIITAKNPAEVSVKLGIREAGKSSFKVRWIVEYIYELGDLTNWFTIRYIAGALTALPISLLLWNYIGILAPFVGALLKWLFVLKDIGPASILGIEALAVFIKLACATPWPITALFELILAHILRGVKI